MGFWGTGLYSNDTTSDVRDTYKSFLEDQLSNEEAYNKTIEQFIDMVGSDEEPLFWYAIAESQWRTGRLLTEVKDKALYWIECGGGLELWEENPKNKIKWQKTLFKLKETLESPMPREKKFPKIERNPWNLYDVYAYQLHDEYSKENGYFGKYMLLQKVGEGRYYEKQQIFMEIQVIDHIFNTLPELEDINRYRILPLDDLKHIERNLLNMKGIIPIFKPSEYPKKHLTFLGNTLGPTNKSFSRMSTAYSFIGWSIDYFLINCYQFWQGKEYKTAYEGVYDVMNGMLKNEFSVKKHVIGIRGTGLHDNVIGNLIHDKIAFSLVYRQESDEARHANIMDDNKYIGTYLEPLFWYLYAYAELRLMRPTKEVQAKAYEWLEKDGGMELWDDDDSRACWRKTLDNLREKLNTPKS